MLYSRDLPQPPQKSKELLVSLKMRVLVISPHAQLILELHSGHLFTFNFLNWELRWQISKLSQTNIMYRSEASTENTLNLQTILTISRIKEDLADQRLNSCKTCMTVSRP